MSSTVGIGAALGLPIAAMVVQYASWHVMFWGRPRSAPRDGAGLVGGARVARPRAGPLRHDRRAGPGPGALLSAAGGVAGRPVGLDQPRILGLFVGSVCVLGLWWAQQLRAERPLVDLKLATSPRVALPHVAALLTGFAFYANSLVTAQLVQAPKATGYGLELSIVATGLVMLPGGVIMLLLSPVSARVSAARGARVTLAIGTLVIAAGYGIRIINSHSLLVILLGSAVCAMGTAFSYSALPPSSCAPCPPGRPRPRTVSTC